MGVQNSPGGNYQVIINQSSSFSRMFWLFGRPECNLSQHTSKRHHLCGEVFPTSWEWAGNSNKTKGKPFLESTDRGNQRSQNTSNSDLFILPALRTQKVSWSQIFRLPENKRHNQTQKLFSEFHGVQSSVLTPISLNAKSKTGKQTYWWIKN